MSTPPCSDTLARRSGAATRERYSWLLFQSVADQAGQDVWFKGWL